MADDLFSLDLPQHVKDEYHALRQLPDGRWIGVHRLLYHWTLHIDIDPIGYRERYCHQEYSEVMKSFNEWDGKGDPPGRWNRHPESGRRRNLETGEEYIHW